MELLIVLAVIVGIAILSFLRQINQYERGVMFTMGRYTGTKNPGWRLVVPIFQGMRKVDMRLKAVDVPNQEAITKDNVSCQINAVIYYKVIDASKAIIGVENFYYAVSQLAQTTMRNVVGSVTLDELLSQRDAVSDKIEEIVDKASENWGINAESVDLKDIMLPESMKRTMAKQAEAEREKRAVIINSEGEVLAAENISKAAGMLAATPGALHLRTLNSINDISSDQSNTIVFAVPLEVLRAFEGLTKKLEK
ncbi:MAG: slipin family protein [Candidatus Parcubacteria bacterium]|nr:slipin family protein [Candidatus Parcubacteria bacterium]